MRTLAFVEFFSILRPELHIMCTLLALPLLETASTLTSTIVSDVVWMWFGRGSDVVRTWFGCGSDVARMWVGGGSDVFSDLAQTVWQKLRESGCQHLPHANGFEGTSPRD